MVDNVLQFKVIDNYPNNNWAEYEVAYEDNFQIQIYYMKDSTLSNATDACYIDNIRLSSCEFDV